MSIELITLIIIGGLLLLLASGTEVGLAMGIIASIGLVFIVSSPQSQIGFTSWDALNSFTLVAMPLFIFMGAMLSYTGAIRSLFDAASKWLSVLPGGLAVSVIGACALFGAMSGSSIAAAATFGTTAFPEMESRGYNSRLSIGAIACGGTLSVLIPPSIILVIYGAWMNQSVAILFAAGLVPGIILSLLLMATAMVIAWRHPEFAPREKNVSWKERFSAIRDIAPWLGMIALVLGVIFAGIMTPTESSALGAFLSIVMALAYRKFTMKGFVSSLMTSVRVTSMVGFVIFTASLMAFVLNSAGLSKAVSSFMLNLPLGKYPTLGVICVIYLILGLFFDSTAMLLLTMPFIAPIISGYNLSLIWFGVLFVVLAEIGMVTPPFGLNLFTINAVIPKFEITEIALASLPFVLAMLIMVVILIAFPGLCLWLPDVLYRL